MSAFLGPVSDVVITKSGSKDANETDCHRWELTPSEVTALLNRAVVVIGRQVHDHFSVGPCFQRGTATIDHFEVTWELFVGGTGYVTFSYSDDTFGIADPKQRLETQE
jgi:hypothetical protein